MIKIRCSELESVRESPVAHGQLLAANGMKKDGGRGMMACVKEVARIMQDEGLTVAEGIKRIQQKFLGFNATPENKEKQERLVQGFVDYCKQVELNEFEFIDGNRQMKWDFSKDTRLTGHTPWVFANDAGFYSIYLTENQISWKHQLRFPLFQQYLTTNTIDCELNEMHVGVFCLETGRFEYKSFAEEEIEGSVAETNIILNTVLAAYNKFKK